MHPCPSCGYCPTCGRRNAQPVSPFPYPGTGRYPTTTPWPIIGTSRQPFWSNTGAVPRQVISHISQLAAA